MKTPIKRKTAPKDGTVQLSEKHYIIYGVPREIPLGMVLVHNHGAGPQSGQAHTKDANGRARVPSVVHGRAAPGVQKVWLRMVWTAALQRPP